MKYKLRKVSTSGKYEVYYLKNQGNGWSREPVGTYPNQEEARAAMERLEASHNGHTNDTR